MGQRRQIGERFRRVSQAFICSRLFLAKNVWAQFAKDDPGHTCQQNNHRKGYTQKLPKYKRAASKCVQCWVLE